MQATEARLALIAPPAAVIFSLSPMHRSNQGTGAASAGENIRTPAVTGSKVDGQMGPTIAFSLDVCQAGAPDNIQVTDFRAPAGAWS